jgi:GTP cyclohydrolase I
MSQDQVLRPVQPSPARDPATLARPELRIATGSRGINLAAAERAAGEFLAALGFPNDEGYDELVLARGIPFRTVCKHHMLPLFGVAQVGYLPGESIVGLSKLARMVQHYAARPQTQFDHRHLGAARHAARRCPVPCRVSALTGVH